MARTGFRFADTKTCILAGAGASRALGYPFLAGQDEVASVIEGVLKRAHKGSPDQPSYEGYERLITLLGKRFTWDLERIYDHLAHVPPDLYPNDVSCNTDWLRQWLVEEISSVMRADPRERPNYSETREMWRQATSSVHPRPIAIFTTNYDRVIETCLADLGQQYEDGWSDKVYDRRMLEDGSWEVAVVKMHGSAERKHARQYTTLHVGAGYDAIQEIPALLAPSHRKPTDTEPYASAYDFFEEAVGRATSLVLLGFSWRDTSVEESFRRGIAKRNSPLSVLIFDPEPYAVEERMRLRFALAGLGYLNDQVKCGHSRACTKCPDVDFTQTTPRPTLDKEVTLADLRQWAMIPGTHEMASREGCGKILVHWGEPHRHYFESGRVVLVPRLPDSFDIDVSMQIKRYGSGWDPGFSLEDDRGADVFFARFIQNGEVWRVKENEDAVDGLRLGRGLEVFTRVPVTAMQNVRVVARNQPGELHVCVEVEGRELYKKKIPMDAGRGARRLHVGAYPWSGEWGLDISGRHTECEIFSCRVVPV